MNRAIFFGILAAGLWGGVAPVQAQQQGVTTVLNGTFLDPHTVVANSNSTVLYITDAGAQGIFKFQTNGQPVVFMAGSLGDMGYSNGVGPAARFNNPQGMVQTRDGLVVADTGNHLIRFVSFNGAVSNLAGLPMTAGSADGAAAAASFDNPVGLTVDAAGNIFVADQGNRAIRKIDTNNVVTTVVTGLIDPTAVAVDAADNGFWVSETRVHVVKKVLAGGQVVCQAGMLNMPGYESLHPNLAAELAQFTSPRGLLAFSNEVYVCDSGNYLLRKVVTNSVTGGYNVETVAGAGYSGTTDGLLLEAEFKNPWTLSFEPKPKTLLILDRGNAPINNLGAPSAVRRVNVTGAAGPTDGGPTLESPEIDPSSGYYPNGYTLRVSGTYVEYTYYTVDGTEPTLNSPRVENSQILWREPYKDLTFLKLKAIRNTNEYSETVSGVTVSTNQILIPRNMEAPVGGMAMVPVVVNLVSNTALKSLQFRLEFEPLNGAPMISDQLRCQALYPKNDFINIKSAGGQDRVLTPMVTAFTNGTTRVLAVAYVGTNSSFHVSDYAVVAMVAMPIPPTATTNHSYRIRILYPTGTSDGGQSHVKLTAGEDRDVTIVNREYLVGDCSPGRWYGVESLVSFGDGKLQNQDVNTVLYASLGIRVPYSFSDAFDAMDIFPSDENDAVGGDGEVRYQDWLTLYYRSVGLDTNNWMRSNVRDVDGRRVYNYRTNVNLALASSFANAPKPGNALSLASSARVGGAAGAEGQVWLRHVLVGTLPVTYAVPGAECAVPVYVRVQGGCDLSGLSFRAAVSAGSGAPAIRQAPRFIKAEGISAPMPLPGQNSNEVMCLWVDMQPRLANSNLIGWIVFPVPYDAHSGHYYHVSFLRADGAPGQPFAGTYDFETLPADVWVSAAARWPGEQLSDEWKARFFGAWTNLGGVADAAYDADGDGASNWEEYLCGTNPTNALSRLKLGGGVVRTNGQARVALRWLSAPGKSYVIEGRPSLGEGAWTNVASNLPGDGTYREYLDPNQAAPMRFYRIRAQIP